MQFLNGYKPPPRIPDKTPHHAKEHTPPEKYDLNFAIPLASILSTGRADFNGDVKERRGRGGLEAQQEGSGDGEEREFIPGRRGHPMKSGVGSSTMPTRSPSRAQRYVRGCFAGLPDETSRLAFTGSGSKPGSDAGITSIGRTSIDTESLSSHLKTAVPL